MRGRVATVNDLIARKAVTRELCREPLRAAIGAFIDAEFAVAREVFERPVAPSSGDARADAEALYAEMVARCFR